MPVKRVALVSEGPSAKQTFPGIDGYDEVIGVNGVVSVVPCTWWVFLDPEFYVWNHESIIGPRPRIVTSHSLERAINTGRLKARGVKEAWQDDHAAGRLVWTDEIGPLPAMPKTVPIHQGGPHEGTVRWDQYGGMAGLVTAWWLAGKGGHIDVYGMDLHGDSDLHDHQDKGRLPRWDREREMVQGLMFGFERCGDVTIDWVAPPHLAEWCQKKEPEKLRWPR